MAKSSTRRVTIYINGKEVEASVKQIRSEMNKLVNEQNRMVIGSDEYVAHAKKIKELRQYHYKKMYLLRDHCLLCLFGIHSCVFSFVVQIGDCK